MCITVNDTAEELSLSKSQMYDKEYDNQQFLLKID